jgi:tetratricopeptide (TPR) repeat protein
MHKPSLIMALALVACALPPARRPLDDATSLGDLGPAIAQAVVDATTRGEAPAAPVSLTASDGRGLELASFRARAVVDGPLAFTELHLRFHNPRDRTLEGRFHVTLPPRAAISRLAMLVDGRWQEAEVVEHAMAQRAYEDVLHGARDPVLLEKSAGNDFGARVFPIGARADKEIIVSFSHELRGQTYRLPLLGLAEVAALEVQVWTRDGDGWREHAQRHTAHQPARDFVLEVPAGPRGMRHGDLVAARIAPPVTAADEPLARVAVLFDTSASRALGFAASVSKLEDLFAALRRDHGDGLEVALAAFDQGVAPLYSGKIAALDRSIFDGIIRRGALGASDLGAAIAWLSGLGPRDRVVVVTDGVATAGKTAGRLRAALGRLRPQLRRLDIVAHGGIRDERAMRSLVVGVLANDGLLLDGDGLDAGTLARRIGRTSLSGVTVSVPGASWVWPDRLDGLQPGEEALVFAELGSPSESITVELGGPIAAKLPIATTAAPAHLLERAAAVAELEHLANVHDELPEGDARRADVRQQMVALSRAERVVCDFTALLVLETEADYSHFGIERQALAEILTVAPGGGVEVIDRDAPVLVQGAGGGELVPGRDMARAPSAAERGSVAGDDDDDDGYGYEFQDDPLAPPAAHCPADFPGCGGFGPNDATIRIRPDGYEQPAADPLPRAVSPYTGKLARVMKLIAAGRTDRALLEALRWRGRAPADVIALVALGEALEARGNHALAARAYGSIIDLYPSRSDMRRFAGGRLERLPKHGAALARDAYAKAVELRPDEISGYRLLAFAELRRGKPELAFAALDRALTHEYAGGRATSTRDVLRSDLAVVGAVWAAREPSRRDKIAERAAALSSWIAARPSLRFVLTWETDVNDVDLHVVDKHGDHAFYQKRHLRSGGRLLDDVINGYGPEAFVVANHEEPSGAPYRLYVHYYSRGPMGYGMGMVHVVEHDGGGEVRVDHRPFVIMREDAYVSVGTYPAKE